MTAADPASLRDPAWLSERIRRFVAERGARDPAAVRVRELRRMAGGASRELWSLDVEIGPEAGPCERLELVLRRDPPGRAEGDRGVEMALLEAAAKAGVPVPKVYWGSSDPAVLGTSFFLMERLRGEALARRLLRDPEYAALRERLAFELGRIAARIHSIDLADPRLASLERPRAGASCARDQVERVAAGIRALACEPHPVLDLAERWLLARAPAGGEQSLVHGDYRVGNLLFDREAVRGVLDWELAHVGDPVEDLGWLCTRTWRFGSDALPAGGVGTREELLAGYAAGGGREVSPAELRFWEAFGSFKAALVWIQQSNVFLSGRVHSLELASLGRRTAEPEDELLRILEEDAA